MDKTVKKELEKNLALINKNFLRIINEELPSDEFVKMEFDGIRILSDYSEKLALEGANAIETI